MNESLIILSDRSIIDNHRSINENHSSIEEEHQAFQQYINLKPLNQVQVGIINRMQKLGKSL